MNDDSKGLSEFADDDPAWRGFDRIVRAHRGNVVAAAKAMERERGIYLAHRESVARMAMEKRRNTRVLIGLAIISALALPLFGWVFKPGCDFAEVMSGFAYGAVWLAGLGIGAVVVRFLGKERTLWNGPSLQERKVRGFIELLVTCLSIMWLVVIAAFAQRFWVPICYSF